MTFFKIHKLTNSDIEQLEMNMHELNNSIYSISHELNSTLSQFSEEQLWVQEKNYEVKQVNMEKETIEMKLEWRLRDLEEGEQVFLLYREKDSSKWRELPVQSGGGLNYYLVHTFPLMANYQTQVIATSKSGKRSDELVELNIKEHLDNRWQIDAYLHQLKEGKFDISIHIYNTGETEFFPINNQEDYKIKSANASLFVNGREIKKFDMLKEAQQSNHEPDPEYYVESEQINFHQSINLVDEDADYKKNDTIELKIVVEDYSGFKYEKIVE